MKKSRSELIYLLLSLITLGLFIIIYITQTQSPKVTAPKRSKVTSISSQTDPELAAFLEQLTNSEKEPTLEVLEQLKIDYDQLQDGPEKEKFQKRLIALEEETNRIVEAENLLIQAESTGYQLDIEQAQAAISALTTPTTKEQLQGRLDTLITNLTGQVPE